MKLKLKVLAAATAALLTAHANAQLNWVSRGTDTLTAPFGPEQNLGLTYTASTIELGDLFVNLGAQEIGTLTFTYLGRESGWSNTLYQGSSDTVLLTGYSAVGDTATISLSKSYSGAAEFLFFDPNALVARNGGSWDAGVSTGLIASNFTASSGVLTGKSFRYVLGFNDSGGNSNDWDDMLVGVNLTVSSVPEPTTYALMLAGLGALGLVARRRKTI